MNTNYLPLHNKYRPKRFDDLVGQEAIATTLKQALITNRIAPAYLFCGPRGTGKTSSARILARSLNCQNAKQATVEPCGECNLCKTISNGNALDVIEIDAASNTGVDNIRDIIEKSKFAPVQARWKVYVIDECHMLSTAAFNALLKTLEEPPAKVVFILATTDPQRLLPTIISRCQRFDFKHIALLDLLKHLKLIAKTEKINIDEEALLLIAKRSQGGLRDAQSMLDQLSLLPQPIQLESVWELLGEVSEKKLLEITSSIANKEPINLLKLCRESLDDGSEPMAILQGVVGILRDLIIKISIPQEYQLCSISKESQTQLAEIAKLVEKEKLFQWQAQLKGTEYQLRNSSQPRLWLEVILLGLLAEPPTFTPRSNQKNKEINLLADDYSKIKKPDKKLEKNEVNRESSQNTNQINTGLKKEEATPVADVDDNKHDQNNKDNSVNLSETWEKILAQIELPSTKMLLSQQAKLIRLSTLQAEISVAANWLGMIESRKNILEKAINQVVGGSKKLILHSQNKPINKEPEKADNNFQNKSEIKSSEKMKIEEVPLANDNIENNYLREDKAKQFANFFNGEIINVEEEEKK